MKQIYVFLFLIAIIAGCKSTGIGQGIRGELLWLEGNLMPGPNSKPVKGKPVKRTVYIYELTALSQVEGDGPVYDKINSRQITSVESDDDGNFKVKIPEGQYSLFVKETDGFFASTMDQNGNINPVTVGKDSVTSITIRIDYKAAY